MSSLFYNLGRRIGPKVRKAKWVWQSLAGSEDDVIRIEREVGEDLAVETRRQLGIDNEQQTAEMLSRIGLRLTACVTNKARRFNFEAVHGEEPNAFALPGGFVFITRSLIELCQNNQDEVAFILGHEMAHVIRGHAMDRIISNSAIAAASRAAPIRGALSGWLRKVGVKFLESAYSQDMEFQADELGMRLAAAAGYDPHACVQLFDRLAKPDIAAGRFDLSVYFSSHPPFNERINNISDLLRRHPRRSKP